MCELAGFTSALLYLDITTFRTLESHRGQLDLDCSSVTARSNVGMRSTGSCAGASSVGSLFRAFLTLVVGRLGDGVLGRGVDVVSFVSSVAADVRRSECGVDTVSSVDATDALAAVIESLQAVAGRGVGAATWSAVAQ